MLCRDVRFLKIFLWFRRDLVMTHQALQDVKEVLDEAAAKKRDLGAIIMNLHQEILINHLLVNVSFLELNKLQFNLLC